MGIDYEALSEHIDTYLVAPFYEKRTESVSALRLDAILKRKNPYLFRAKNIRSAGEMANQILTAHLSSQEETIFGNLMEELAIHICQGIYGGFKPPEKVWKSIDLIFDLDETRYLVGIKSGPNWGNSDQVAAMKRNFKIGRERVLSEGWAGSVVCVNGVMYGRDNNPLKIDQKDPDKTYYKYCGQDFWSLISGDRNLYTRIIAPLGEKARFRDEHFQALCVRTENRLTSEILSRFVENDEVQWELMVQYVSQSNSR